MTDNDAVPASSDGADSDETKEQRFLAWLKRHGATFSSLKIETGPDGRQLYAAEPMQAGTLVMHIPESLLITAEMARKSEIGERIASLNFKFPNFVYLSAYLAHLKREGGFWKPYLDMLPQDFSWHPLLFSEDEIDYLKGCSFLPEVLLLRRMLTFEHQKLLSCMPEKAFTKEEYTWARCICRTRVHFARISGASTSALVPLADMSNHCIDPNARWDGNSSLGFIYTAARNLDAGAPLTIMYSVMGNSELFAHYGFCLENNPDDFTEIELPSMASDHPCFDSAKELGTERDDMRVFKVKAAYDRGDARAMFSYLRLCGLTDQSKILPAADKGKIRKMDPISRESEQTVLIALAAACERRMQQFATSIEEDDALLKGGTLPLKLRFAVQARRGEKAVLKYSAELAETALHALHTGVPAKDFSEYFADAASLFEGRAE